MTHPSTEQLSEYLDRELPPGDTLLLEGHLAGCAECSTTLAELRRVLARAQALEDRPPREDLWPGVAAAIGAAPRRRWQVSLPVPMLLAAGVALMLVSGGAVALLLRGKGSAVTPQTASSGVILDTATVTPVSAADNSRGYDAAIRSLETELAAGGGRLDSVTVRIVNQKLNLIDRAIAEAERALARDPANSYLHGHLAETRMRKLDLLRRATALTHRVS